MIRLALTLVAALIALVPRGTEAASSINTTQPVQGAPFNAAPIRSHFGAAANDIAALQRLNAGATAPTSPGLGTTWLDTSATPYLLKTWSVAGSQWVTIAAYNQTSSQWIPPVGGGSFPSITSAATTNLGSVSQAAVNVTGNQSIASFGSSVPEGQVKFVAFTGSPTLVQNSTFMILPAGANVTLSPGQSIIAVSLGSGAWRIWPTGNVMDLRQSARGNPTPGQFYADKAIGSDSADCLTATVTGGHGPCLTIGRALTKVLAIDGRQNSVTINYTGTFSENVTVNGATVGTVNSTNFVQNLLSSPLIRFKGSGSASAKISGGQTVDGQAYCYAVLAINGAMIALENTTVEAVAAPAGCNQSALFAETAVIFIDSDVKLGPANGDLITGEEGGNFYVTAGCANCTGLTLAGDTVAGNAINISANSWFSSDSTINIQGARTFGGGFLFLGEYNSLIKLSGNPAVTDGASVTAARFYIAGNSDMVVAHPPTVWPGTIGGVDQGGRYQASDSGICLGGTVGCTAVFTPTNIGGSGTAATSNNSGLFGGDIRLDPLTGGGPAPSTSGLAYVGWRTLFPVSAMCTASLVNGTGTWNARATVQPSGFSTANDIHFLWDNNGVGLTSGLTYFIVYNCANSK